MYGQEEQKAAHLIILICNTVFTVVSAGGAMFFQWDMRGAVLLAAGLIASWTIHIVGKIPESIRLWMYVIFTMTAFFFYGTQESNIDKLAPVMGVILLIYTVTKQYRFIRVCAASYYLTMCYDFVFILGNPLKLPGKTMMWILLHFVLVLVAERLAEMIIRGHKEERKAMDAEIFQLEEANRRAEDFLANVSHELRTPINAVTGMTAVMLKNDDDPERTKNLLSIQMAGNRLFDQIEDILDYTEIDTGKVVVSEDNYMLSSLINDIIIEHQMRQRDQALELIFDVDAGIPLTLFGDGKKVKKIIRHLLNNSVKFTKKGGVYIRIFALPKTYGINLCIKVSDTGMGIAEEELGKIKERFFQSSGGRSRIAGGLGLGLSIVYGMVTAMNGFIQIDSKEGEGTTILVSIPQKVSDPTPSMEVPERSQLCIALYLRPEKYEVPAVRDYYNTMVSHMVQELDLSVHRVFEAEELKKLVSMYRLTHLIIGREEYEENVSYFESLDSGINVIVVADERFRPSDNSRINLVKKPFYGLPIVNILNAQASLETEQFEQKNMICPGVKVLVVDDEPMNLMVAEGIFRDYQMEVKTAGSGTEAIELCKNEDFDLIFLDHMMPEMDGVETLKILRKNQTDSGKMYTVIAFTANAVSGAREMFLREGFDEFISKPVEDQELKRLLRKVLPKSSIVYVEESERKKLQAQNREQAEADTAKTSRTDPGKVHDDSLHLLEEKGFQTAAGLQYCNGDRAFYETVLLQFADDAAHKTEKIDSSLQKQDYKDYQIMVHALKSSAKMIGAPALSDMAKEAESAAKNQDEAYIRRHHSELLDKYRETAGLILDVLRPEGAQLSEEPPAGGTELSRFELLERLWELKNSLKTFEADKAESQLEELNGSLYEGASVRTLLSDVRKDVEDFELAGAAEKVEALIARMEGGEA